MKENPMATTDYLVLAVNDAKETTENFFEEIIEQIIDSGDVSNDLFNDYAGADSYHHENSIDKNYSLTEAAELLSQLKDYEETDYGLWQGLEPKKAITCQAAFTYGNAVMSKWQELIKEINDDDELQSLICEYQSVEDEVNAEMDELEKNYDKEVEILFVPPWNVDTKIEQRQKELTAQIDKKVKEIINNF